MDDDLAAGTSLKEGVVVGDVTVGEVKESGGGGRREGGDVAGAAEEGGDGVAVSEEGMTESSA